MLLELRPIRRGGALASRGEDGELEIYAPPEGV
jgi:hypothetical protein